MKVFKAALMLAATFALVSIGLFFLSVRSVTAHLSAAADQAGSAADQVRGLGVKLSAPGGLLDSANTAVQNAGATILQVKGDAAIAAHRVNGTRTQPGILARLDGRLNDDGQLLDSLNKTVQQVRTDAAAAAGHINGTPTMPGILPTVYKAVHDVHLVAGQAAINEREYWSDVKMRTDNVLDDAHHLLTDPCDQIQPPLAARPCVEGVLANLNGISGNFNAITGDLRFAVHKATHPSGLSRVFGMVGTGAKLAPSLIPYF